MPALVPHCSVVTRAIEIIAAAGFRVLAMPTKHTDRSRAAQAPTRKISRRAREAEEIATMREAFTFVSAGD